MSPIKRPISERPCRAVEPARCRVHGFPAKFADLDRVVDIPTRRRQPPHPILTDVAPVEHALQAGDRWAGETPAWWSKFTAEAQEQIPENQPELLDVLDTPIGEVGVVWLQNSPRDAGTVERDGMRVNYLAFYHPASDETVGYLKATFVDDETFAAAFGDDELTPYRYAERYRGGFYADLPDARTWESLTDEEKLPFLQETWTDALRDTRMSITRDDGSNVYYGNARPEDRPQTVEQARASLKENFLPAYEKEASWHRSYYTLPFIEYSSVNESLKGKGFGTALYIYAARRLAENKTVLRGSGLQTDEASNVWRRLEARFPDQVSTVTLPDLQLRSTEYHIFDMR